MLVAGIERDFAGVAFACAAATFGLLDSVELVVDTDLASNLETWGTKAAVLV